MVFRDIWKRTATRDITICPALRGVAALHIFADTLWKQSLKAKSWITVIRRHRGVQYINRLFEHERYSAARKQTSEQRYTYRLEKEKPVLDAFWKWISQQCPKKGTRFEKAVNYAQNHKDEFMTYLEDGRCSFSNNLSENSIRPFTVGRRNWLFSDTPKGADASSLRWPRHMV